MILKTDVCLKDGDTRYIFRSSCPLSGLDCYRDRVVVVSCPSAGPLENSVRVVPKNEHRLVSQSQYALKTRERSGANETKKRRAIGSREASRRDVLPREKRERGRAKRKTTSSRAPLTISSERVDSRSTVLTGNENRP